MPARKKVGFYAGSFDPVTNGHVDIIKSCLLVVDSLIIAVGAHPSKSPMLPAALRADLLTRICAFMPEKSRISVHTFDGLAVHAAREQGATILLRGIRDGTDLDYEMQLAAMNAQLNPHIPTIFIPASPATRFISSTNVRQIARMKGDISPFVPDAVGKATVAALTHSQDKKNV
jgi:pantetheine-phosphate adenylyltransferase